MSSVAQHFMENATTKRIKTAAAVTAAEAGHPPARGVWAVSGGAVRRLSLWGAAEGCRRDACI